MKILYHFLLILLFSVLGYPTESNSCNYWTQGANMPTSRQQPHVGAIGDSIYTLGHLNGNHTTTKVEIYNTKTNVWATGPSLPFSRAGDASVIDKKIYLLGGNINNTQQDYRLVILDTETSNYSYGAEIPNIGGWTNSVVIDKKIYLFGGYSHSTGIISNKSFIYNPSTDVWTQLSDIPLRRHRYTINYYNGKVYFIGGAKKTAGGIWITVQDVDIYDVANNSWSKGTNMPTRLLNFGQNTVIGDKIYVTGAQTSATSSATVVDALEIYDISENSWSTGANMPTALVGKSLAIKNKLYVFGNHLMYIYTPCIEENKEIKTTEIRNNSDLRSLARDNNMLVNLIDSNDIINIYLKNGAWTGSIKFPTMNIKEGRVINVYRSSSWGSNMHLSSNEIISIPKGNFSFKYKNGKWISNLIIDNAKLRSLASTNNTLLPEILDAHDKVYIFLRNGAWTQDIKINIANISSTNKINKSIIVNRTADWGSKIHIGTTTANILKGTTIYTFEF